MFIPPLPTIIPFVTKAFSKLVKYLPMAINLYKAGKKEIQDLSKIKALGKNTSTENKLNINALLVKLKNEALENSYQIQEKFDDFFEDYFDSLKELLETKDISSSALNRISSKNSRQAKNTFKNCILAKISLSNEECVEILSLKEGEYKENLEEKF